MASPLLINAGTLKYPERFLLTVHEIETKLEAVEGRLTQFSVYPVLGTPAGIGKMMIGLIQMISGLALSIIFRLGALFAKDNKMLLKCAAASANHILKGLKNLALGFLEAVPGASLGMSFLERRGALWTLPIEADSRSKDEAIGTMLKSESRLSGKLLRDYEISKTFSSLESFRINIGLASTKLSFPTAASLQKSMRKDLFAKLQGDKEREPPKVEIVDGKEEDASPDLRNVNRENKSKFAQAIAERICSEYSKLTPKVDTVRLDGYFGAPEDGYVYEIAGDLKRRFFRFSRDKETVDLELNVFIYSAFFQMSDSIKPSHWDQSYPAVKEDHNYFSAEMGHSDSHLRLEFPPRVVDITDDN